MKLGQVPSSGISPNSVIAMMLGNKFTMCSQVEKRACNFTLVIAVKESV